MFLFQLLYKLDAKVYPVGFEVDEVEPTAIIGSVDFSGEINQFCKGSSDLLSEEVSLWP